MASRPVAWPNARPALLALAARRVGGRYSPGEEEYGKSVYRHRERYYEEETSCPSSFLRFMARLPFAESSEVQ